jgi:hypothetical protein
LRILTPPPKLTDAPAQTQTAIGVVDAAAVNDLWIVRILSASSPKILTTTLHSLQSTPAKDLAFERNQRAIGGPENWRPTSAKFRQSYRKMQLTQ